jgi:hypothetical protein
MAKNADKKTRKAAKAAAPKQESKAPKAPKAKEAKAGGSPFKHVGKKKLTTGKGATPAEIGRSLVDLFNQGKSAEAQSLWQHKKIESIEADGTVFLGKKGVAEKDAWWYASFEVHNAKAEGPFVGATGFTVHFSIETSPKGGGERTAMREVGVFTVSKGKIVREEFMGLASA